MYYYYNRKFGCPEEHGPLVAVIELSTFRLTVRHSSI